MSPVSRPNTSIFFWNDGPNLSSIIQTHPVVENRPFLGPIYSMLGKFWGSPFVEYWILNELLSELISCHEVCVGLDVYIKSDVFCQSVRFVEFKHNSDDFLREMSIWLTQQIAAIRSKFTKYSSLPDTFVQCHWVKKFEQGLVRKIPKYRNFEYNNNFDAYMARNPKWVSNFEDFWENNIHEFWGFSIRNVGSYKISGPSLVTVSLINEEAIKIDRSGFLKIGKDSVNNEGRFPLSLLAHEHAEIAVIRHKNAIGENVLNLWIRHLGYQETWVGNIQSDGFFPLSRGMWVGLESGNYIIMGRVVQVQSKDSYKTEKKILPGSLVLEVHNRERNL